MRYYQINAESTEAVATIEAIRATFAAAYPRNRLSVQIGATGATAWVKGLEGHDGEPAVIAGYDDNAAAQVEMRAAGWVAAPESVLLALSGSSLLFAAAMRDVLLLVAHPDGSVPDHDIRGIQHPVTGEVALLLGGVVQRVHPDADLQAFVQAMPIPANERNDLKTSLEAQRGAYVPLADYIPPSLAARTLTQAEAHAAGWIEG